MMMSIVLAASTFSFAGGSSGELAEALSRELDKPIAILLDGRPAIPAFTFEWSDASEFWSMLRSRTTLESVRDNPCTLYPSAWPTGILLHEFLPEYMVATSPAAMPGGVEELQKFRLPGRDGEVYSVIGITSVNWHKPVVVHWTYKYVSLAISGRELDIKMLTNLIAQAVGGKFVDEESEYRIDFDPETFRRRAIARYNLLVQDEKFAFRSVDFEYASAVLSHVSNVDLERLYAIENNFIDVELPFFSRAHDLVFKRLESQFGAISGRQVDDSTAQAWARIRDGADFTKPFRARLHTDGRVFTVIQAKDPKGVYVF